jgi:hypothetical protein
MGTTLRMEQKSWNQLFEKYGCKSILANTDIREKGKVKILDLYGVDNISKSQYIKNKKKETSMKNWGVDNPLKSDIIREKIIDTTLKKHNTKYPFLKEEYIELKNKNIKKNKKNKTFELFKSSLNKDFFEIIDYKDGFFEIYDLRYKNTFVINRKFLYDRIRIKTEISTILNPVDIQQSGKEIQLINWFKLINIGLESPMEFIEGDRKILEGKELDIYIPSKNIAIEFNGLYWHSENFKERKYHLDKSLKCQEQGIQLLHIWEDEWVYKKDIIKSIILNRLGLIKEKIYARQCEIRVIEDSKLVRKFLDENHIQGYSQSSIKLGLYYKNELVSLMTFGYRHTNAKKEFELIRFCNRINLNVIGSASKLFNYFKQNYHFTELISYSDFRLFDGSMYQTLGFTKQHLSKPDYFWCKDIERKHRFNFNKQKLIKEGYDPNKTEVEIMYERGYFRIFGCGQHRWIYKK